MCITMGRAHLYYVCSLFHGAHGFALVMTGKSSPMYFLCLLRPQAWKIHLQRAPEATRAGSPILLYFQQCSIAYAQHSTGKESWFVFFFKFPFPFNSCFLLMAFCCSLPQTIAKQPVQEFCLLLGEGRRLFGNHKATSPGNSSFINVIITIIMDWLQCTHCFRKQNKDNLEFAREAALEVRCVQLNLESN